MNFAVIGTNFISDNFADAVKKTDGAKITAVYSRAEKTGSDFAEKHGGEIKIFTSYERMLSEGGFDAVYVASPTVLHAIHSIKALESGYHVLCEKMMAATLEDFYLMKSAAQSSGRVLLEAMRPSFDPAYVAIRNNLSRIGKIRRASLTFCQYSSRYDRFKSGILTNAFDPKMKNSALSDIGIYPLNIAVSLFGEPMDISSTSVFLENGFEAEGASTLAYSDKIVSVIYSKINDSFSPSVIEGEDGAVLIDKLTQPSAVELKLRSGMKEIIYAAEETNNMVYEIDSFMKMCSGRLDFRPYLSITEKTQVLVDKIYGITDTYKYF
jgi:predicted dehydrogenase